jgi:hypothetical protein
VLSIITIPALIDDCGKIQLHSQSIAARSRHSWADLTTSFNLCASKIASSDSLPPLGKRHRSIGLRKYNGTSLDWHAEEAIARFDEV